ncbi:MAG: hypothetical protein A3J01_02075 [Candidatus Yanofskybacteria bacterium RIFCSPLOWO2_02_FULL_45_18]|uniref:Uncharacterized protein n=1 Tax=Candidatus Yanofskybacteria bacterium RIFCSPLOWO2_02_FULL_45_18 TaxID=1802707 RepID=A0A1F8H208_9BACT|nr:MAG: hypothetical protein A3J01_02075 [Candidatus Yanofskybacteria bacterium RIFCSPLOWO2_02_FULL_45_18]
MTIRISPVVLFLVALVAAIVLDVLFVPARLAAALLWVVIPAFTLGLLIHLWMRPAPTLAPGTTVSSAVTVPYVSGAVTHKVPIPGTNQEFLFRPPTNDRWHLGRNMGYGILVALTVLSLVGGMVHLVDVYYATPATTATGEQPAPLPQPQPAVAAGQHDGDTVTINQLKQDIQILQQRVNRPSSAPPHPLVAINVTGGTVKVAPSTQLAVKPAETKPVTANPWLLPENQ